MVIKRWSNDAFTFLRIYMHREDYVFESPLRTMLQIPIPHEYPLLFIIK